MSNVFFWFFPVPPEAKAAGRQPGKLTVCAKQTGEVPFGVEIHRSIAVSVNIGTGGARHSVRAVSQTQAQRKIHYIRGGQRTARPTLRCAYIDFNCYKTFPIWLQPI